MSEPDRGADASSPVGRLHEALRRLADQTRGRPRTGLTHQDADVTGTAGTDDAAGFDPLPLLRTLDLAGARVRLPKVLFRTATASGDCCTPALPWGNLPVMDFLRRMSAQVMRWDSAHGAHDAPDARPHAVRVPLNGVDVPSGVFFAARCAIDSERRDGTGKERGILGRLGKLRRGVHHAHQSAWGPPGPYRRRAQ